MMARIEEILGGFLDPENYGYRERYRHPALRSWKGVFLGGFGRMNPTAYDCMDAALIAQQRLGEHGIHSSVWRGIDEFGIWDCHFFPVLDDGTIVDCCPQYRLVNPNHKKDEPLSPEFIDQIKNDHTFRVINGEHILRYHQESPELAYLSIIGVNGLKSFVEEQQCYARQQPYTLMVSMLVFSLKHGKPDKGYLLDFNIDKLRLHSLARKGGFTLRCKSLEEIPEGIVTRKESGIEVQPTDRLISLVSTEVDPVQNIRDYALRDVDTVLTFAQNVADPIDDGDGFL